MLYYVNIDMEVFFVLGFDIDILIFFEFLNILNFVMGSFVVNLVSTYIVVGKLSV